MTKLTPPLPLSIEQLTHLHQVTKELNSAQLGWLSGYFWALSQTSTDSDHSQGADVIPANKPAPVITILSASQTGNARRVAEQLRDDLLAAQLATELINAGDLKIKQIARYQTLILVISTQGEGEPPEEAMALHKFLLSKKAPDMGNTAFAVFGLGDSSYNLFCQAGKDFDARLAELGAQRLLQRVDSDIDFAPQAEHWRQQLKNLLSSRIPAPTKTSLQQVQRGRVDKLKSSPYSKQNPFIANLSINQKITGRGSDKDVRHIEISLNDSGLSYQPGDALGIWYENDPDLVNEILGYVQLSGDEVVTVQHQQLTLQLALLTLLEITVNTAPLVAAWAEISADTTLLSLDNQGRMEYAKQWPLVDMLRHYPASVSAQQLATMLRPLTPRLYSIASSQAETEDEVHITVAVVRYQIEQQYVRYGAASSYLAYRLPEDGQVRIFIEHNDHFRLPADPRQPVIMIGAGTGIAPFRAFIQQRDNQAATGNNWLIFGNPHFIDDFLYQVEWQHYVSSGLLTRIDLAWSRDSTEKIYVQHVLRQQASEVWRWLERGAHFYVCGDATHMAKEVEQTLLDIISEQGAMPPDDAEQYLSELRQARRYQRDVY